MLTTPNDLRQLCKQPRSVPETNLSCQSVWRFTASTSLTIRNKSTMTLTFDEPFTSWRLKKSKKSMFSLYVLLGYERISTTGRDTWQFIILKLQKFVVSISGIICHKRDQLNWTLIRDLPDCEIRWLPITQGFKRTVKNMQHTYRRQFGTARTEARSGRRTALFWIQ